MLCLKNARSVRQWITTGVLHGSTGATEFPLSSFDKVNISFASSLCESIFHITATFKWTKSCQSLSKFSIGEHYLAFNVMLFYRVFPILFFSVFFACFVFSFLPKIGESLVVATWPYQYFFPSVSLVHTIYTLSILVVTLWSSRVLIKGPFSQKQLPTTWWLCENA